MSSGSPDVVLYDGSSNALAIQSGSATPANTPALMIAGSDGTNSRFITLDSSGRQLVVGAGVAGTPAGGVITIQGVAGGTVVPVSGTVTANIGTTNGLALDASVTGLVVAQASTTSGQKGTLTLAAVTTAAPTYTTAQTSPLSLTTTGLLRIDGSGVTQPVSGTITANAGTGNFTVIQATATNLNATVVGTGTDNTTNSITKMPVLAAVSTTGAPTYTTGNMVPLSVDTAGNLRITGSISASNPSVSTTGASPPASATYVGGSVTTAAPTYTTGQMSALSLDTAGNLRVSSSAAAAADTVGSTTALGALNNTASVNAAGQASVGVFIASGTLAGTVIPEVSFDGGTTWIAGEFNEPITGLIKSSIVFTNPNAATSLSIIGTGGASQYRVRVSAYTSGTANATLRATSVEDPSLLHEGPTGSALPPNTGLVGGASFSQLVSNRVDRVGNARVGFDTILLLEQWDSSTINTFTWTPFVSGMTISGNTSGTSINNGSSLTPSAFAVLRSNRFFQLMHGGGIRATFVLSSSINSNVQYDFGFGNVNGSNTATGAWFSTDFSGNLTVNIQSSAKVSSATITTVSQNNVGVPYIWIIETVEQGARFIIETQAGVRLYDNTLLFNSLVGTFPSAVWGVSHVPIFTRVMNRLSPAPVTAGTTTLYGVSVLSTDINTSKTWSSQMAGIGRSATLDPAVGTQLPQLASAAAPTAAAPSNTASLYTTLGGEFICNATASSEALLSIFSYTIPAPFSFYLQGIIIPPLIVNGAAVATTATVVEFAVVANCASTNINTGGGQRFTIPGFFQVASGAAVGTVWTGQQCNWEPSTPIVCLPGTVLHIAYKVILGTATASNKNRGNVYVDGFFE